MKLIVIDGITLYALMPKGDDPKSYIRQAVELIKYLHNLNVGVVVTNNFNFKMRANSYTLEPVKGEYLASYFNYTISLWKESDNKAVTASLKSGIVPNNYKRSTNFNVHCLLDIEARSR